MKRWFRFVCVSIAGLACGVGSLSGAEALIFEGRVTDLRGKAVPGVEVQVIDSSGRPRYRALSDIRGVYRFPALLNLAVNSRSYRLTVSHLRYKPVRVDDLTAGARIDSPGPESLVPGQPVALLAATRVVSRDFSLTPSLGTPQNPAQGPVDPNLYEYYYQQALLLLGQDKKKEAVVYLKLYAQAGSNLTQVARALTLIAQNDSNQ